MENPAALVKLITAVQAKDGADGVRPVSSFLLQEVEVNLEGKMTTMTWRMVQLSTSTPGGQEQTQEDKAKDERKQRKLMRMEDNIHKIQGWALAVATLLVGMAFQAANHPPDWVPNSRDLFDALRHKRPGPVTKEHAIKALLYLISNTVTFSTALTLAVLLLIPKELKPGVILKLITPVTVFLAVSVTCNFTIGISDDMRITLLVLGIIVVIAIVLGIIYWCNTSPGKWLHQHGDDSTRRGNTSSAPEGLSERSKPTGPNGRVPKKGDRLQDASPTGGKH